MSEKQPETVDQRRGEKIMKSEESVKNNDIKILIVEDNRTQAVELQCILEQYGYHAFIAHNGLEALTSIHEHKPTLIINNIMMPEMNGYEMCHAIKHDESLKDIPVVLLTTLSASVHIIQGLQAGTDSYLTKPHDENYLLQISPCDTSSTGKRKRTRGVESHLY